MSEDLLFIVEVVFDIKGRGAVLCGEPSAGSVAVGDRVTITEPGGDTRAVRVTGIDRNRKAIERAVAGEGPVGLLVEGVCKDEVTRGSSIRAARTAAADASPVVASAAPAAWMTDPTGRHESRYWDGTAWTGHVADAGVAAEDPLATMPAESANRAATLPAANVPHAGPDLERMRALFAARLAQDGPSAFAHLHLDTDPMPLPERVVLLGVQLGHTTRPGQALSLLDKRAAIYEALGMTTEADRDRLAWAAIKEGHSGLSRTSREWAAGILGFEFGSTFTHAYDILTRQEGEKVRVALMKSGRAVALGYCPTCRRVEQLDDRLLCPAGHAKIEDVACVVPQDVATTRQALERAHRH
jgi:hypothetical protein